jgi:hypothetical protein
VVHAYDPNTQEAETGGWQIQDQTGLNETLSQKTKATQNKPILKINMFGGST